MGGWSKEHRERQIISSESYNQSETQMSSLSIHPKNQEEYKLEKLKQKSLDW